MNILRLALPVPLPQLFDYRFECETKPVPGVRVKVPFGKRTLVGILIEIDQKAQCDEKSLKDALEILDDKPVINSELMDLCQWVSDYYQMPLGLVFDTALTGSLKKGKPNELSKKAALLQSEITQQATYELTEAQNDAIKSICDKKEFNVSVLHGITGSGKTEVYMHCMQKFLENDGQVLLLVPEIGLTPQTLQRFQQRFIAPIATFHSRMTDRERLDAWNFVESGEARIIIGTRSSVFLPFKNLKLIMIDEEHDASYKQQDRVRYHARDLSIMRAHKLNIPIVLGSATPSLETFHNVEKKKFDYLALKQRPGNRITPSIDIIDVRQQRLQNGISHQLINAIHETLGRNEQALLFLNRRGYAPVLMCHQCGWLAACKRCEIAMTLHQQPRHLHCHHCDKQAMIPRQCPDCGNQELQTIGIGTEKLEETIGAIFPNHHMIRVDRDNTSRKNSFEELMQDIQEQRYQIILGTQMLAKGHDFPNITLVGIIDMDGGFFSSNFRAIENMAQLIRQVAGRAGRADKKGHVYIQTHHPDHPLLHTLLSKSYNQFAQECLQMRESAQLPPYTFLTMIRAQSRSLKTTIDFLSDAKNCLPQELALMGPIPAAQAKRAGFYRGQLLLQSPSRNHMQHCLKGLYERISKLKNANKVRWHIDVDPTDVI